MEFTVNATRFDPYKNFKFRVKWDGRYIFAINKVSALKVTTQVIKHRDGGTNNGQILAPGTSAHEAITFERGLTHDPEFENWAFKIWNYGAGAGAQQSLKDFRKDLYLEVQNEAGQVALAYKIFRCWVSEYALPEFDANANGIAIERIKVENEGWERDLSVKEPTEPTLTPPTG